MQAPMGMQMNALRPGNLVRSRFDFDRAKISHWKYSAECDLTIRAVAQAMFEVLEVNLKEGWIKIAAFGSSPPRELKLSGDELAGNFFM